MLKCFSKWLFLKCHKKEIRNLTAKKNLTSNLIRAVFSKLDMEV